MTGFKTTILKFNEQGEKTGWSYIKIPAAVSEQLKPGNKKSFRVKGSIDSYVFDGISLLPMGGGHFIIPLNAEIRKAIGKQKGATVHVQLELQDKPYEIAADFLECLKDEPRAFEFFNKLTGSHRNYFSKWIESAKTEPTRIKRITMAVNALSKKWDYGQMIRSQKQNRDDLY